MKFFLNPKSIFFRIILVITLGLWIYNLIFITEISSKVLLITHYILSFLGIGLIAFAFIPWYGFKYKGLGIEDHYEKILLPTTYLLFIYNILMMYRFRTPSLNIFLILLFLILITINFILLSYHYKDSGKAPPSYFAANLYLKADKTPQENHLKK